MIRNAPGIQPAIFGNRDPDGSFHGVIAALWRELARILQRERAA